MRVARIVAGCSDTDVQPKPPWRDRKNDYIRHLKEAPAEVIRVSLADKLHNARAILGDYRLEGERLWSRSDRDADQLWYYRALATEFRLKTSSPMARRARTRNHGTRAIAHGALARWQSDGLIIAAGR